MSTTTERLLLQTDVIVTGQEKLVNLSGQMIAAQNAQAASSTRAATSLASLDRGLAALPARETAASAATAAMASSLTAAVQIFNEVYEAGRRVAEVASEITQTGFQFDRWQAQFTVLEHSPDKARARMVEFQQFADQWRLPLPQVVDAAATLDRVGILTDRSLRIVASIATNTGRDMTEVAEKFNAASRGMTRGVLDFFPAASSTLLKFTQDVESGVRKSPEALAEFIQKTLDDADRLYGNGLEVQKQRTEASFTALANKMEEGRDRIAHAGWSAAMKDVVDTLVDELDRLEKDGTLEVWAHDIGVAATAGAHALDLVIRAAPAVLQALKFLGPIVAAAALGAGLTRLAGIVASVHVLMLEAGLAGSELAFGFGVASGAVTELGAAIYAALGPAGLAAIAIGGIISLSNQMHEAFEKPLKLSIDLATAGPSDTIAEIDRLNAERAKLQADRAQAVKNHAEGNETPDAFAFYEQGLKQIDANIAMVSKNADEAKAHLVDMLKAPGIGQWDKDSGAHARTKADTEAFKAALEEANRYIAGIKAVGAEVTKTFLDDVMARLDATGAEGAARLALFDQYAAQERQHILGSGALRRRLENDLEDSIARDRIAVVSARLPAAVEAAELKQLAVKERAGLQAIAAEFSNGQAEVDIAQATAKERTAIAADADKQMHTDRARAIVADAQFERGLYGLTTDQYLLELRRRLAGLANYSAEAQAILKEIRAAEADKGNDEDRIVGRAVRFNQAGLSNENANAAANEESVDEAAAQRLRDIEQANFDLRVAQLDAYKGLHGKAVADMTETELRAHAASVAAAKSAYGSMTASVAIAFKTMGTFAKAFSTDEQLRMQIIAFLTQKNAKEAVAAYADEKAQELKITAIDAAVTGFLDLAKHDFTGAAAAFKASALAGGESFVAAAVGREYHALAIQAGEEPGRGAAAGGGAAAAGATSVGGSPANSLSISQANQPITNYFYNTQSFTGGVVFLDKAGARMLAEALVDPINELVNAGAIRVR